MASRQSGNGSLARAPEGFVRVGAVADAPFFALEPGNVMHGKLLGFYERDDKRSKTGKSNFYQLELISTCKVREGRGEDAKVRQGQPGEIVNFNHNPKTKVLEPLCKEILAGALYEVYAPCLKKIALANGNTMWNIDVHVHMVRMATPLEDQAPDFEGGDEVGDVPAGE